MVPDLLVSKVQHSDSVFQKVFNFYFQSCLPRQPLYPAQQFLRELADISKGAQNTCTSLVVWYLSWSLLEGGSLRCAFSPWPGAFSRQSLARMQNI